LNQCRGERLLPSTDSQKRGVTFMCNMRGWTWDNFDTQYALAFFHTLQFNFPVHVERFVLVDAPAWFAKVAHYVMAAVPAIERQP
jgi:hypothetical protein